MKKILLIILGLFISFLLIFFFILKVDRELTLVEKLIKEPVLYVEKIIETQASYFENKLNVLKSKNKLVEDLNKLKNIETENKKLESELKEKNNRIEELSDLVNINKSDNYELVNTNIIVRNVGLWYQTLILDKGEDYRIKKNDMVINSNGLIGLIDKVSKHTSGVKLLTSINDSFKIGVLIDNNGDTVYGILSEYKNGLFEVRGISYNKKIEKGSVVKTSGLDDRIESGINIGRVENISKDNLDLEQIVYVKPSVDFNRIKYASVMVMK